MPHYPLYPDYDDHEARKASSAKWFEREARFCPEGESTCRCGKVFRTSDGKVRKGHECTLHVCPACFEEWEQAKGETNDV